MDHCFPIYTTLNECHDCYKCVRRCPAKAIKVKNGSASVIPELCVSCGECVLVCPSKAKKIRQDVSLVKHLLNTNPVTVSLAPSWVSSYENVAFSEISNALKSLGFNRVEETSDGADWVSSLTVQSLNEKGPGLYLSSACPSAVEFIFQFMPQIAPKVLPISSPAIVHAAELKRSNPETKVVFIGPCAAKKVEADRNDEIDAVLTFEELDEWFKEAGVKINPNTNAETVRNSKGLGVFYPIEGGMLKGIKKELPELTGITLSGLANIENVLEGQEDVVKDQQVFVELLACVNGCINGPGCNRGKSRGKLQDILAVNSRKTTDDEPTEICKSHRAVMPEIKTYSEVENQQSQLESALADIGKFSREDELNCAGCGYQTCRNFAKALIVGKAESAMCVSYMRKLAQKKANALIRYIPAGVVVVGRNMEIIESNQQFAKICGEDIEIVSEETNGLKGADLSRIIPFTQLFEAALASGNDLSRTGYTFEDRIIDIRIFSIEPHNMVGAIIEDVTEIECRRSKIADKAREVIDKNVATVQQIAKCLGEHMAETEIILRQVATGFEEKSHE